MQLNDFDSLHVGVVLFLSSIFLVTGLCRSSLGFGLIVPWFHSRLWFIIWSDWLLLGDKSPPTHQAFEHVRGNKKHKNQQGNGKSNNKVPVVAVVDNRRGIVALVGTVINCILWGVLKELAMIANKSFFAFTSRMAVKRGNETKTSSTKI